MYDVVVAIHVVAAIVGFGVTFTYPVIQLTAERLDARALPFAISVILSISNWVAVPATTLVGATGIYQVASGPFDLGDLWVAGNGLVGESVKRRTFGSGWLVCVCGGQLRFTLHLANLSL